MLSETMETRALRCSPGQTAPLQPRACRVGEVWGEPSSPEPSWQSTAAPLGSARLRVGACAPGSARIADLSSHVHRPRCAERRLLSTDGGKFLLLNWGW